MMRLFFALSMIAICMTAAYADVTITSRYTMSNMGISLNDQLIVEQIKGSRACQSSEMSSSFTAFASFMMPQEKSYAIVDLDKAIRLTVYPEDSTYSEVEIFEQFDTLPSLVPDLQSIDSATMSQLTMPAFIHDTTIQRTETYLGIPCTVYRSNAFIEAGDSVDDGAEAVLEIWVTNENEYNHDASDFYRHMYDKMGNDADYHFAYLDQTLSQMKLDRAMFDLDSLDGIPVKYKFSFLFDMSEEQHDTINSNRPDFDTLIDPEFINQITGYQFAFDSLSDSARDHLYDSLINSFSGMFDQMFASIKPGRQELVSFDYEIISIDSTALPDSLFGIPEGYKER